ncbi:MAG: acyltransferase family protein [candidate division Zixibacteria bacterium]|nr:acyltransferase family protein [candidate division Zixibacteria bacterium]
METKNRRYDIDWLRVIAIAILLVFHIMVMFQSYANQVSFIQSPTLLKILLVPLSLLSVMRIPLLFFVSGMGVFFSLQRRTWLRLLGERAKRILIPLVFGSFAIVPIHKFIYAKYYSEKFIYSPESAHLWFLINILMYVSWFLALFYFVKEIQNSKFFKSLRRLIEKYPFSIYFLTMPYILESLTIPADVPYALYYDSRVGLLLGAVAFFLGFIFITLGEVVWKSISKIKYYSLSIAFVLFLIRLFEFKTHGPHILTSIESISWIIGALGLGYVYLNKPSKTLGYLSAAAYPIYIVHMIFLYLGAYIIFPLSVGPWISLILIIAFTFGGSFLSYEIIRRIFFLRPLFGLKSKK